MAAVASAADPTDLMQKLSLDSQSKTHDAPDAAKKPSGVQHGQEVANWPMPVSDRSNTPVLQAFLDPNVCYTPNGHTFPAYYYGGNDWEEYPRYLSPGIEMPPHGLYGDMYHGYAYPSYGAYGPGSGVAMGHDGQLYNAQHYQYPGAYYQQNAPVYATNASTKPLQPNNNSTTSAAENPPLPVDKVKPSSDAVSGNANAGNGSLLSKPVKSSMPKGSYNRGSMAGISPPSYQDQRFAYDGMRSPAHWVDAPVFTDMQHQLPTANSISNNISHAGSLPTPRNQNTHHLPPFMASSPQGPVPGFGLASPGYARALPHSHFYSQYGNSPRNRQPFGPVNGLQANDRNWFANDSRYNVRGRGVGYSYGNKNMEVLNELNRGPRADRFKNGQKSLGSNVVIAVKDQGLPTVGVNEDSGFPDRDQYNREDFQENYSDARFFVIKSYSEDDIHKSIKYGVWASTPNGNKKLDDAYKEAQEKANTCPIFLFFSVNTSGQFVGVAEMVGPVDFNKTVDYWQQDKWNGCFPVKWHIVKDVPNNTLKHIILENNEGKPVTNSRDTQEVRVEQGNQMLKLFKDQISKTSVLDDFGFYETRQKIMQAKRVKQQFQKQVWDGKAATTQVWDGKAAPTLASINIDDIAKAKQKIQKPWEPVSVEAEETAK